MARKPKPPISAWIVRERKRLGLKPEELARQLTAMNLPTASGTPRTWEAGRQPSAENIEGLEKLFGTRAPTDESPTPEGTGLSELLAKLDRQAELMSEWILELRGARQSADEARELARAAADQALRNSERLAALEQLAPPTPAGPADAGRAPRRASAG